MLSGKKKTRLERPVAAAEERKILVKSCRGETFCKKSLPGPLLKNSYDFKLLSREAPGLNPLVC